MLEIAPDPGQITAIKRRLVLYYEIYREYLRLGVKSFLLEWSRVDNRVKIKAKWPLDLPSSFLDFMITYSFIFAASCRAACPILNVIRWFYARSGAFNPLKNKVVS